MTANQALRRQRRRHMRQQEAKQAHESIVALVLVIIWILVAFNVLRVAQCDGMTSQQVEAAQLTYWQEQGVTVARW